MQKEMLYTIYMPWVARKLQEKGFKLIRVEPARKTQYNVYIFKDSADFQAALNEILEKRK
jgi:hypothetical protein